MKTHHIGYLTNDIEASSMDFRLLGYDSGIVVDDEIQQCKIRLLTHHDNGDIIELVEPKESNLQMQKLLKKRGNSVYHICYEVEDVNEVYNTFCGMEGWMNIFKPVKAIALSNRLITYFYNTNIGFVEFVNSK